MCLLSTLPLLVGKLLDAQVLQLVVGEPVLRAVVPPLLPLATVGSFPTHSYGAVSTSQMRGLD